MNEILQAIPRELAIPTWLYVTICMTMGALAFQCVVTCVKLRRTNRTTDELIEDSTKWYREAIENLAVIVDRDSDIEILKEQNKYLSIQLTNTEHHYEARVKSMNDKLKEATNENRKFAVSMAKGVCGDFEHNYKSIYRFLQGKETLTDKSL